MAAIIEAYVSDTEKLVDAVLAWWEEHQYDVDQGDPDPDGYKEDFNRYNSPPEFVKQAQAIKEKYA